MSFRCTLPFLFCLSVFIFRKVDKQFVNAGRSFFYIPQTSRDFVQKTQKTQTKRKKKAATKKTTIGGLKHNNKSKAMCLLWFVREPFDFIEAVRLC